MTRLPHVGRGAVVTILAAAAFVALIVAALLPRPAAVGTATVSRGPLAVTVEAEGVTRVRDRYVVSAPVAGRLERVALDEGDAVQRGTLVGRIDPLPQRAAVNAALAQLDELRAQRAGVETMRPKTDALAQADARIAAAEARREYAQARVAQARAVLAKATGDLRRDESLGRTGAIPHATVESARVDAEVRRREVDAAEMEARAAASELTAARAARAELAATRSDPDYLLRVYDARIAGVTAQLERLQDEAARTDVRSPVAGRVLRVIQRSEQFVASGTPLVEIGDPARLEVVVDVLSSDAVRIAPGDAMSLDFGGGAPLAGVVRRIEPSAFTKVSALGIEEQRVHVVGSVTPTTSARAIGDGYRVEAAIVVWRAEAVTKVPLASLFRCADAWCVYAVVDGRARRRTVVVGQRNDQEAQILRGVAQGERVIVHPGETVTDGSRVHPE